MTNLKCLWFLPQILGFINFAIILQKLITLPSREEMHENLRLRREASRLRFRDIPKNAVRLDMLPYCDDLAEAIGCRPNLGNFESH